MLWITLLASCSLFGPKLEPIVFETALAPPIVDIRDACILSCNHRLGTAENCPEATAQEVLIECRDDCRDDAEKIVTSCYDDALDWFACTLTLSWLCPQGSEEPLSLEADSCAEAETLWNACAN